jgi:hypothetical protein
MNWKDLEGRHRGIIEYYPSIYLEGLRETKNPPVKQMPQPRFKPNTV